MLQRSEEIRGNGLDHDFRAFEPVNFDDLEDEADREWDPAPPWMAAVIGVAILLSCLLLVGAGALAGRFLTLAGHWQ